MPVIESAAPAARRALAKGALPLALIAAAPTPAGAATQAFVRVDQVGYAAASPKRAYLMSSAPEPGASFAVRRVSDGAVAFSGAVGAPIGAWSAGFPDVYALDFDPLSAAGSYVLEVSGPVPTGSPASHQPPEASMRAPNGARSPLKPPPGRALGVRYVSPLASLRCAAAVRSADGMYCGPSRSF